MVLRENQDTFYISKGELTPALEAQLTDEEDNPVDLTGVSEVRFKMYNPREDGVMLEKKAVIKDASKGIVTYVWKDGETDESGRYRSEFVIQYGPNASESFPNFGYKDVLVWGTDEAPIGDDVDKTYPSGAGE